MARPPGPSAPPRFAAYPASYWSTYQSEWATDLVFRDAGALRRLYPRLLHHAVTTFGSADVVRFLGRRLLLSGDVPTRFAGEAVSDLKQREEGIRIKHSVNGNSVKLYDKAYTAVGNVLRAEAALMRAWILAAMPSLMALVIRWRK